MTKSYLRSRIITPAIALLLAALPFISSAQVVVHLTILPPYSTKLSDYFSRPQQVLLMVQNTTATNQNVQLRGEFTGDNGVSIRADQNYKSGSPIRLGPNETRTLSINDIAALFNINEVVFTGISKEQFIRQNGVPDGNYQICVQAFDYYTNKPLSGNAPAGCSNVFPVSSVEDPTVIAPFDEQVVSALAGQNFVISWSTPAGAPPSTQYTVKMVQIFDGKSPSDAFNTAGIPIFFQQTVTGTNSLVYGPAMPALTQGRHYAMAITASDPMNTVTFKNHGQSVITSFIYGDTAAVRPIATTVTERITLPGVPILTGTIIPTSTIVGNIKWYFSQSEENAPSGLIPAVGNMPARIPGSIAHPVVNTPLFVSVMPIYKQGGVNKVSQINKNLWNKNQSNTVNEDRENDVDQSIDDDIFQGSNFTSNTDANGNFSISLAGILETISQNPSTSMKLLGYTGADSLRIMISSSQVINGSISGTFGGFSFTYPISAINSGIDVGNLKAIANTYRFKPRVVDGSGKELTDATVNVYRRADFYSVTNQQLQYEGNYNANQLPREQVVINGINYVKVAALKSGYTATRLFFQQPSESYELQIDEGDYTTMYTTLSANSIDLSSFTLQQTYSMANAPTILAGTVYKKLNGISIPAQGAVVSMITNGYLYTSSTDSSGNFGLQTGYGYLPYNAGRIAPVQITPTAQTVLASYNGQSAASSVVINQPGKTYNTQVTFDVTTFPIAGRVVDDSGNTIPNPVIKWQSTGQYVPADDQGNFNTTNVAGTDSLIISKLGYAEKHYGVVITTNGMVQLNVKIPPNMPRSPIPLMVNPRSNPNNGVVYAVNGNVGSIMLDKAQGEIDLHINDQQGNPIPGALVNIDATPLPQDAVADNTGLVRIIGPAGTLTFDIKGPAGSNYVPLQTGYYIPDNNTITTAHISLTNGVKLTGRVTANGTPVAGAVVGIQGQDYGTTTTGTDGSYSVIEPIGSYQLEATKQGYLADLINGNYTANQTVNFTLSVSSVNITKLLGFNVQVDQVKNNGNSKLITGEFINLPSNSVFSPASGATIKFQDVAVTIQPDGTAMPVGGTVYTSQSTMNLKAFGYLPIVATNSDQDQYNDVINVIPRGTDGKHGQIMCTATLDFASFTPPGIPSYFPDGQIRIANNPADPQQVVLLTDDGSAPGNGLLTFSPNGSNQLNIYGFKLNADFQSTYIQSDGIHLNGSIDFSNLPVLSSSKFNVQALIGKDGMVSKVTAQPNLSFSLAGWSGTVSSFSFNENGFTLGGNINVQMPASGTSTISFSNLQIAKDQVYGGSFTFPNSGVNVFNIANINASGISFGKLGNSGTYYLSASKSSIAFTGAAGSYIDPITLSQFQIQTDGKFAVTAQTDLHNSFFGGVATVNVSQLGISNLNGEPAIDINGDFGLSIPGATASVGGIHFKSGGRISVDNLGIGFDVAGIAKANVNIGFKSDNSGTGFSGSGDFNVGGFADIGVGFSYYKGPRGFDLATSFTASTDIPLGTSGLSITQLGGGFSKKASNNSWDIDIKGTISVAYQAFASANVDFNIANGPVITGSASLNIANMNGLANGKLIIDVPDKFVSVDFNAGINMLGISGDAGGRMVLSLDKSDPYYMMGMYSNASAFGLITLSGGAIAAYNLDMNKHRKELLNYFSAEHMPLVGADGKFSGISMYSQFEEDLRDILPNFNVDLKFIDIGLHSYFNMGFYGFLSANLADYNPRLSVGFGVNYNMGGDVEFSAVDLIDWHAGLAVGFNADFAGSVTINPNSLSMSADAGAQFHAYFGDISPGYCITGTNIFNIPPYDPSHWWVSLCFNPRLHIDYSTQNGFHFSYR